MAGTVAARSQYMSRPSLLLALVALSVGCSAGCSAAYPSLASGVRTPQHVAFAVPESTFAKTRDGDELSTRTAPPIAACRDMTPTAALRMFLAKKKHRLAYIARSPEAEASPPRFDEEVLVLSQAVTWSSTTSSSHLTYDVLRWDGTCAPVDAGALSFTRPRHPMRPITIERLYLPTQVTLLEDKRIHAALERAHVACEADPEGAVCDVATRALGAVLVTRGARLAL